VGAGRAKFFREIKIRGDVKTRQRLEVHVLDHARIVLDPASDGGAKLAARRERRQAEHLEEPGAVAGSETLPVIKRPHVGQASVLDARGFRP